MPENSKIHENRFLSESGAAWAIADNGCFCRHLAIWRISPLGTIPLRPLSWKWKDAIFIAQQCAAQTG